MMATIGAFGIIIGIGLMFSGEFGIGLFLLAVGLFFVWGEAETTKDNRMRHENDYGKVARCYKCGSTDVYLMTYDDKRESIAFWGSASSKLGKRYHCDNCGNEW